MAQLVDLARCVSF
ncbi:TPA: hypothetical protein KL875_004919 [Escherichia coli]|nr:hypothetical protein [Escherichia coli]HBE4444447.1 hypothetical protein [Escherichia coli]HBE6341041.1 hypothetical protein [Escherichia coli]HDX9289495.1 hypothetical protein [Escherichia coli]